MDTLVFRTWAGTATPTYTALRIRVGQGLGGRVLAEGRPIRTANYREDPDIPPDFHAVALAERFVAEIGVPIRIEGAVAGVLFVMRRMARPFSAADETILTRLADQAAIAIANARLFQNQQQAYVENSGEQLFVLGLNQRRWPVCCLHLFCLNLVPGDTNKGIDVFVAPNPLAH